MKIGLNATVVFHKMSVSHVSREVLHGNKRTSETFLL